MNDDLGFRVDGSDFTPHDEDPLIFREISDFELRIFFNPSRYNAEMIDVKPLMTRASLRAGVSSDLSRIKFGEIVIRLNPAISGEEDVELIKNIFLDYFGDLPQVTTL